MIDNIDDLKKKSLKYKQELKREQIKVPVGDTAYDFRISGIGEKSFKIEKYVKYDDIIEAIEAGNDNGLESIILELVDNFESNDE